MIKVHVVPVCHIVLSRFPEYCNLLVAFLVLQVNIQGVHCVGCFFGIIRDDVCGYSRDWWFSLFNPAVVFAVVQCYFVCRSQL